MIYINKTEMDDLTLRALSQTQIACITAGPHLSVCEDYSHLEESLCERGFAVIREHSGMSDCQSNLPSWALARLGEPMLQADRDGQPILEISIEAIADSRQLIHSNLAQALHTDAGYARRSPSYIVLRCIEPATSGGETLVTSLSSLKAAMRGRLGATYEELLRSVLVEYKRASGTQTIALCGGNLGRPVIKYSPFAQSFGFLNKHHWEVFQEFTHLIYSVEVLRAFRLPSRHSVIIDNSAVLHGRTAFHGLRRLARRWFAG